MVGAVAFAAVMVELSAAGAVNPASVLMLCVSEARLGAGFVVMATGTASVCSSVCCGDDGMAAVGCETDVRCMLLSVVAVLGWATVRGFADGAEDSVVTWAVSLVVTGEWVFV